MHSGMGSSTPTGIAGKAYWRSLDELADTVEFREFVEKTLPGHHQELLRTGGGIDRRRFLQLMAASLGLAGMGTAGCRRPEAHILPYTKAPEEVIPGLPVYYATSLPRPGGGFPVLVESHEGRPTKIEGNPLHPITRGTTDAWAQASILDLYDPDRSKTILDKGAESDWDRFVARLEPIVDSHKNDRGRGLHILSGDLRSPTIDRLRRELLKIMPEMKWHVYEPIGKENVAAGGAIAFGNRTTPTYRIDKADVILTLDCDLIGLEDDGVRHQRGFAAKRRVEKPGDSMNRLYTIEPKYTTTGGMADHRLRMPASHIAAYALALAGEILKRTGGDAGKDLVAAAAESKAKVEIDRAWIEAVAADLLAHRGGSVVVAGRRQPPVVHALAHAINDALGAAGSTVVYHKEDAGESGSIQDLAHAIMNKSVKTLIVLGSNPVYDAPADLGFGDLLRGVEHTIHWGMHVDETARACAHHVNAAHSLESWGDVRDGEGVLAIQPLIDPLFGGKSAIELLAAVLGLKKKTPYEIVRETFKEFALEGDYETSWKRFLHEGRIDKERAELKNPSVNIKAVVDALKASPPRVDVSETNLELTFDRDAKVDDGRYANNGWMQEAPDPITKITWDNAATIGPATARKLGVETGDVIELAVSGLEVEIVALVLPGQADGSIAVPLGYGRTQAGKIGSGVGFNTYKIRTSANPDFVRGVKVRKTGERYELALTQDHSRMEGRDIVREIDFLDYRNGESSASASDSASEHRKHEHPDIQERPEFPGEYQWGMAIDLNTCLGCNACTIACQSENNVPIVGKGEVIRGREMHWIRNDRYFSGDEDDPGMVHQPVACVHCENAPCEAVCPVNAAVHSDEGLNLQVYNRCVGTRYCANNCPYKVRRFNFFNYNERPLDELRLGPLAAKGTPETLKMRMNPDVTVRIRGVMEKCTYCVQRIERGKIGVRTAAGDSSDLKIPDGTIVPACAQACPSEAIVFGDTSDPTSRVSRIKKQSRDYELLGELNTKPRTTYQARLKNLNPAMASTASGEEKRS